MGTALVNLMAKNMARPPADLADIEAQVGRLTIDMGKPRKGPNVQPPAFGHILVALDGTAPSKLALDWALGIAKAVGAKVTAVSVAPPPGELQHYSSAIPNWRSVSAVFEEHEHEAMKVLGSAKREATQAGVHFNIEVMLGSPVACIVRAAKKHKVDLIVMGSHGHGTLERIAGLGSVAENVKHYAHCSVLIARSKFPAKGMVLGTDGSKHSTAAVITGLHMAHLLGIRGTVVHAVDVLHGIAEAKALASEAELEEMIDAPHHSFQVGPHNYTLRVGNAAQALFDVAKEVNAGLIIVGPRGLGAMRSILLGSVSRRVARYASVSVLIVKPAA